MLILLFALTFMNFQLSYTCAQGAVTPYSPAYAIVWITNNTDKSTEYNITFKSSALLDVSCTITRFANGCQQESYVQKVSHDDDNELYETKILKPYSAEKELNEFIRMAKGFPDNKKYYRRKFNIFDVNNKKVIAPCQHMSVLLEKAKKCVKTITPCSSDSGLLLQQ